jgi:nucleoside-diphosphate-sugar epimerase
MVQKGLVVTLDRGLLAREIKMATVVTGATGYLGSHLVAELLTRASGETIVCLARPRAGRSAQERVLQAVCRAWFDQGRQGVPPDLSKRIQVRETDFGDPQPGASPAHLLDLRRLAPAEFWHCAACVKFQEEVDDRIWTTNVGGVLQMLRLARELGITVFNHLSTAYVAGTTGGRILEALPKLPCQFNNVYEESKSQGELAVAGFCTAEGMAYRILRPSIVIGHSRTFRTSSGTGVYRVAELVLKFHRAVQTRDPSYFTHNPIRVCVDPEGGLNTIPVDHVIGEMIDLSEQGRPSLNQVFHLTGEGTHNSYLSMAALLGMVGIPRVEPVGDEGGLGPVDRLLAKGIRAYRPYLNGRQVFDRSNLIRCGVDRQEGSTRLDLGQMKRFVFQYFEDNGLLKLLPGAA